MNKKNNARASIKDIAKLAEVSIATVSKVLNGKDEHISPGTKEKIKKIARQIGYVPNTFAKGLKNNSSKILGLILPDNGNAFPEMAKGAEDEATKRDYSVIFCCTNGNQVQEQRCINMLIAKMADGIIYVSSNFKMSEELMIQSKIPYVAIDRNLQIVNNGGSVTIDNYRAMADVVDFMIRNCCKRIAHITADINHHPCNDRFKGLCDGLSKYGMELDKKLLYIGDFSVETGYIGAMSLFQRDKTIDSIICGNDLIAIGAMNALNRLNVKIPEQVKVIGFDDIFIARYTNPELTTVKQNAFEMGRMASKMLIDHFESGSELKKIVLNHEIIQRGSV